jgi:uncharacterized membrane protein YqiK
LNDTFIIIPIIIIIIIIVVIVVGGVDWWWTIVVVEATGSSIGRIHCHDTTFIGQRIQLGDSGCGIKINGSTTAQFRGGWWWATTGP